MKRLMVLLCALVLAMGLVACSDDSSSSASSASDNAATESAAAESTAAEDDEAAEGEATEGEDAQEEAAAEEEPAAAPAATVDVSNVDFDVAAMSDEDAFNFMHDFTNRTPDELDADEGKVMHIKGQVSRYTKKEADGDKVSDSVGIKGEGGTIWGVNFYVEGWTADDYPEHKAQVEVTGVWGKVDGYGNAAGRTLICNAEDVILL